MGVPILTFSGVTSCRRETVHLVAAILTFSLGLAPLSAAADPLDVVFARIDKAAKTFTGMTADISNTQYTRLVDSSDVQTGTIKLLRDKTGQTKLLIDFKLPGAQTVSFDGQLGKTFNPKTLTEDVFPVADRRNLVNQLLVLGFGASSTELKSTYDVTYTGDEKIDGTSTSHLRLTPKSPDTLRTLKQADLWYADSGLVLQQKFLYPSGDYKLVKYSNPKLGAPPAKDLEIKLPAGVKIQKH
jgi:hypothetical protein